MVAAVESRRRSSSASSCTGTKAFEFRSSLQSKLRHTIDYAKMPPIYKIPLWELNCQFGIVTKKHSDPALLKDAVRYERKQQHADVTLVFAIRQAGCSACREHALQVSELTKEDPKLALMATVKDTGYDDEGILEFYEHYFNRNPIFKDEKWNLYKALGGKKLTFAEIFQILTSSRPRYSKGIRDSSMNANVTLVQNRKRQAGWLTGGILVFDRAGDLVFVLQETPGIPMDMEQVKLAIAEARMRNAARGGNMVDESQKTEASHY